MLRSVGKYICSNKLIRYLNISIYNMEVYWVEKKSGRLGKVCIQTGSSNGHTQTRDDPFRKQELAHFCSSLIWTIIFGLKMEVKWGKLTTLFQIFRVIMLWAKWAAYQSCVS